jgi:hypothetical protein
MTERDPSVVGAQRPAAVARLSAVAHLWDELIRLPVIGRRIGLDAIVGLIPGVGDVAAALVASGAVVVAFRLGAPPIVLVRMVGNIAIDTVVGAIPLFGDLFDFAWHAQRRNVLLLERWVDTPHAVQRSSRLVLVSLLTAAMATVLATCWLAVVVVRWVF